MNSLKKKPWIKLLALTIATSTSITMFPAHSVLAAPSQTASSETHVRNAITINEAAVSEAITAIELAKQTGKDADAVKAKTLINSLSPANKIKLYVSLSKSYYLSNYKNSDFKFFNPEKYLAKYADVRAAALLNSPSDIYAYALEHYLTYGIFEARSSGTSFDPIVAILAKPETLTNITSSDSTLPDTIFTSYAKLTSKTDTSNIKIIYSAPTVSNSKVADSLAYTLIIEDGNSSGYSGGGSFPGGEGYSGGGDIPGGQGYSGGGDIPGGEGYSGGGDIPGGEGYSGGGDIPGGEGYSGGGDIPGGDTTDDAKDEKDDKDEDADDDADDDDADDNDSDDEESSDNPPAKRTAVFRNNKTQAVTPYDLIGDGLDDHIFSFITNTYSDRKNGSLEVASTFMGKNYKLAQELAKDKEYTFMIYMCGTDQEIDKSYMRVSAQIASMMAADMDNVNVLLFVGGTNGYANTLMHTDAKDGSTIGASDLRSGIYYLNPSGLPSDVKEKLGKIDFKNHGLNMILAGKDTENAGLAQDLLYDDIINSNSLIQLSSTTAIDMSDPALLAGFINFASKLFPADDYGLALSNHGGGLLTGVISADSLKSEDGKTTIVEGQTIRVNDLEAALAATNLFSDESISSDGKLGMIFYDACLMGSTEQAYNTKDYYRYMIASEEVTRGWTNYASLISKMNDDVANNAGDRAIAIDFTELFAHTDPHNGGTSGELGSIVVYSSSDMDEMYSRINDLSKELSKVLTDDVYSKALKNDVFTAIRKASLSSYTTCAGTGFLTNRMDEFSFIDIGDFYNCFKQNFDRISPDSYSNTADKQAYETLYTKLDSVLASGFMAYISLQCYDGFGEVTAKDLDKAIPLSYTVNPEGNLWPDRKAGSNGSILPYGSSFFMPLGLDPNSKDDSVWADYKEYYKGTDLDDYIQFIDDYRNYNYASDSYRDEKRLLADELSQGNLYAKIITQADGNSGYTTTLTDSNGKAITLLTFQVAETYEDAGFQTPEHSTGSPLLDILETQTAIQIAAVHRQNFAVVNTSNDEAPGLLLVDMICAEEEINPYFISVSGNTITYDVSNIEKSLISGFALFGNIYEGIGTQSDGLDWQFVLRSNLEHNATSKNKAVRALLASEQEFPTPDNILTILGGTQTYDPDDKNSLITTDSTYHAFVKTDDSNYSYVGSLQYDLDNDSYTKIADPVAISSYHYVLASEKDEYGNVIGNSKTKLEGNPGFKDGFYKIHADSPDSNVKITVVDVTERTGNSEDPKYNGTTTGYLVDISGTGYDYSSLAYVESPRIYESGGNTGNGYLRTITAEETDSNFIASIGEIVYENLDGYNKDTDVPDEFEFDEEDIPVNNESTTEDIDVVDVETDESEEVIEDSTEAAAEDASWMDNEDAPDVLPKESSEELSEETHASREYSEENTEEAPKSEEVSEEISNEEIPTDEDMAEEPVDANVSDENNEIEEAITSELTDETLASDESST